MAVIITILKFICLALGIAYGLSNVGKLIRGLRITDFQMWAMSIGIAGFVTLQWLWR